MSIYASLCIMIATVYMVRLMPFMLFRGSINNRFIKSFLYYVPYVTLSVMTFPAIIYATGSIVSGIIALAVAVIVAWIRGDLFTVAISACTAVFIAELFIL
ncbi:MAG: AzlD domain-containing protein [Lachnospiraceae bacterium]|nr:AzlD domain-containing protein [Lachnospiraceae bacterium]